jgi:hypothetical protein
VTDYVAIGGAAGAVLALLFAFVTALRLRRLRRDCDLLQRGSDGATILSSVARQAEEVAHLRAGVAGLHQTVEAALAELSDAVRHVAVIRYDAFQDMGGRLSFSAALLDNTGDGLVISSINSRSEARTYAKGIRGGRSEHNLSPEEQQAIEAAMHGVLQGSGRVAARDG